MKIKDLDIEVVQEDIVWTSTDAIVSPTNSALEMRMGLAKIIKREGGVEIEEEILVHAPKCLGEAMSSYAGKLKAKYIIHSVVIGSLNAFNDQLMRLAVRNVLACADDLKVRSLAFPALGCAEAEFPHVGMGKIMVQEFMRYAREGSGTIKKIKVCLYDKETFEIFKDTIYGYINHVHSTLGPGPYVTVDVIIETPHGVVLIERSNPPYGWALPGGFLDYGESLEQAATREAKEETNLDLVDLRQFYTYSNPDRDARFHTISTVFIARGKGDARFGDDACGLKIVRYEDLLELDYAFDHKQIIEEYLAEKTFS